MSLFIKQKQTLRLQKQEEGGGGWERVSERRGYVYTYGRSKAKK